LSSKNRAALKALRNRRQGIARPRARWAAMTRKRRTGLAPESFVEIEADYPSKRNAKEHLLKILAEGKAPPSIDGVDTHYRVNHPPLGLPPADGGGRVGVAADRGG
jgi:hypothetical protein